MRNIVRALIGGLVCAVVAVAPGVAQTTEYNFTIIAGAGFEPFDFGWPAINNGGWVAFRGSRDGRTGIWRDNGERRVTIFKQRQGSSSATSRRSTTRSRSPSPRWSSPKARRSCAAAEARSPRSPEPSPVHSTSSASTRP